MRKRERNEQRDEVDEDEGGGWKEERAVGKAKQQDGGDAMRVLDCSDCSGCSNAGPRISSARCPSLSLCLFSPAVSFLWRRERETRERAAMSTEGEGERGRGRARWCVCKRGREREQARVAGIEWVEWVEWVDWVEWGGARAGRQAQASGERASGRAGERVKRTQTERHAPQGTRAGSRETVSASDPASERATQPASQC